ncbi:hypothetical protein PENDEC_c014G00185 [Penicillium decumbens]|uniref:LysM domain-containing protein n=1 Tax=Penicillium decumbens TaxID=69771 RepID=A0A1V6P9G9_PENDC|nr:hypothetical protein PENDEC_c014G00185 [Penicillium decumbens]
MVVLFKPAIFLTLGVASLALSAAINNDVLQSREDAVPAQVTPSCNLYYRVQYGDTCWDIITHNNNSFGVKQLMCWNPDINDSCSNLIPGHDVCVGVVNNPNNPLYC